MLLDIVDAFRQKRCYDAQTHTHSNTCKGFLALGWLASECLSHTSEQTVHTCTVKKSKNVLTAMQLNGNEPTMQKLISLRHPRHQSRHSAAVLDET